MEALGLIIAIIGFCVICFVEGWDCSKRKHLNDCSSAWDMGYSAAMDFRRKLKDIIDSTPDLFDDKEHD